MNFKEIEGILLNISKMRLSLMNLTGAFSSEESEKAKELIALAILEVLMSLNKETGKYIDCIYSTVKEGA